MNSELNHLYDLDLLNTVCKIELQRIINNYNFTISDYKRVPDNIYIKSIAISKNNLIVYFRLSTREGYELCFRYSDWPLSKIKDLDSFINLNVAVGKTKKNILEDIYSGYEQFEEYTKEYFEFIINKEITFIETHFPTVFTEGDLSMFEEK